MRFLAPLLAVVGGLVGCASDPPEVVEVKTWEDGCSRSRGEGPLPPDTLAYPPGRRAEFRVVALGGCVDAGFYELERQVYAVLDSLIVPGAESPWPFDSAIRLYVDASDSLTTPRPLDRALTVALAYEGSMHHWRFGFTPETGLLWVAGHHGPYARLASVSRSPGDSVVFSWPDARYPFGGPRVPLSPAEQEAIDAALDSSAEALFDRLDLPPAPLPPPPAPPAL